MSNPAYFSGIVASAASKSSANSNRYIAENAKAGGFAVVFAEASASVEQPGKQTLEEFKKEFYEWIGTVPVHPSQANAARSVTIHDKVFEKMMTDPEYRAEVEGVIRRQFSAAFAFPPAFTTMSLDADGEYRGTAGGSAHMGKYANESRNAFWSRDGKHDSQAHGDRFRAKQEHYDELALEKARDRRLRQKESAQDYFYRFTRDGVNGQPYGKSDLFISPPLDFFAEAAAGSDAGF